MAMADFSMRHLWLVLAREYRVRVRTRAFIVSTIATPLMFAVFIFLPAIISAFLSRPAAGHRLMHMMIVCGDRNLATLIREQLALNPHPSHQIDVDSDTSPSHRELLNQELDYSEIVAYAWLDNDAIASGRVAYYARPWGETLRVLYLRHIITMALVAARLSQRGTSPAEIGELLGPPDLRTTFRGPKPPGSDLLMIGSGAFVLAYVLFFSFISYGAMLMQSVVEEKLSHITELLLVSTRPEELMAGKILGVGCVGLTQIAIWLVLGAGVAMLVPDARAMLDSIHMRFALVIYFVLFYLFGYLLFSVLYAVAGVSSDGIHRSSQWAMLVMLPLVSSLTLLPMVSAAPDSTMAAVASMIPYFAPILMYARIATASPPGWQIALSIAIMAATIVISTILCARIYRVGILMYGKRPSLREVARWLRYA
ncbi:MAG TPA: ABC transporter permease [Candidatus Binataceae bacterium]